MSICQCDRLDDYLLGELPAEEAAGFEAHLAGCPACREELRQQRKVDRLLSEGAKRLEPVPSALIDRIEGQYRRSDRRRAARWAGGLSAAAVLLVGLVVWLATGGFGSHDGRRPIVQDHPQPPAGGKPVDPPGHEMPPAPPVATLTFADPSEAILVPLESKTPNVSIFWVYPTVRPLQRAEGPRND